MAGYRGEAERGKMVAAVGGENMSILSAGWRTGPQSSSLRSPLSSFFTGLAGWEGSVSAAKDTGVSAVRLGNIVHQGASVMGSSLWQWSSGHKSKRAHKHHMTDGWEDSFGQGGRDGEREIKWDREGEREKDRGGREISRWSVSWKILSAEVYGCPCSMSAVKGETGNHEGNHFQLMSGKET